ncbi:hypothetical protein CEXT_143721 [Caerostris extrusa]|uniref:Uncharacterized protein n=1 Tax=Caerostris extrusa TaxID=172846 RepID=A0AAV4PJ14_CAEEX|nr:hypothetical protein CEXT_143721 [Caerostris extrusa]
MVFVAWRCVDGDGWVAELVGSKPDERLELKASVFISEIMDTIKTVGSEDNVILRYPIYGEFIQNYAEKCSTQRCGFQNKSVKRDISFPHHLIVPFCNKSERINLSPHGLTEHSPTCHNPKAAACLIKLISDSIPRMQPPPSQDSSIHPTTPAFLSTPCFSIHPCNL